MPGKQMGNIFQSIPCMLLLNRNITQVTCFNIICVLAPLKADVIPEFLLFYNLLKRFYLLIFREGGMEREREGEKHRYTREKQYLVASHMPSMGDLAHNPGMCPDQESNHRPFALWDDVHSTQPCWSELIIVCIILIPNLVEEFDFKSVLKSRRNSVVK